MARTIHQTRRTAKRLLRWCLINGTLDESRARKLVDRVVEAKRRGYLSLLKQFQRLVNLEQARHTAIVQSTLALPTDLQMHVRKSLESSYGPDIKAVFTQNPKLLGGIRIQVGSDVYDGSVRGRLAAMARVFGIEGREPA